MSAELHFSDETLHLREQLRVARDALAATHDEAAARDDLLQSVRRELVIAQVSLLELQDLATDRETKTQMAAQLLPEAQALLDAQLARVTELTQTIGVLEDKLRAGEAEQAQLQTRLADTEAAHRRSLVAAHLATSEARAAAQAAEQLLAAADQRLATAEAAAARAATDLATQARDNATLRAAVATGAQLCDTLERTAARLPELDRALRAAQDRGAAAERDLALLRAEAAGLRQRLAEMETSLSWKLTRTLRTFTAADDTAAPPA